MRILGVDPGLTRCGLGVVDLERRTPSFVTVEVLRSTPDQAIDSRLHTIGSGIRAFIEEYRPDAIALEQVFAQANLPSVMGVAQVSGIVLFSAAERGIPIAMLTPSQVKAAVTGYGAAEKAQVGAMVARILRLASPPKPADAADALAIAIAHGWSNPTLRRVGGSASSLTPAQERWQQAERSARGKR